MFSRNESFSIERCPSKQTDSLCHPGKLGLLNITLLIPRTEDGIYAWRIEDDSKTIHRNSLKKIIKIETHASMKDDKNNEYLI